MVAIINPSPSLNDVFHYNENKVKEKAAEFIHAANYPKDTDKLGITDKLNMLKKQAALNQTTELNAIHISLNFDPSERLDKEKLIAIADSYMDKIGFGKQPYLVYEHTDAGHPHIHIVTTNIRADGTRINTFMIGKNESSVARIQIEKDFGLVIAKGQGNHLWEMPPIDVEKVLYGKKPTKQAIANVVNYVAKNYRFSSISEFNAILGHYNVFADRGEKDSGMFKNNGLVYRVLGKNGEKIGVPIKASSISTKPTIKNLSDKFKNNKTAKEGFIQGIKNAIDWALLQSPGMPIDHLQGLLKRDNIDMLIRKNDQGIIFGITYIDQKHKAVFNGRDLSPEYAAKRMLERCRVIADPKLHKKTTEEQAPFTSGQLKDSPLQPHFRKEEIKRHIANMKLGRKYSAKVMQERWQSMPGKTRVRKKNKRPTAYLPRKVKNSPIQTYFPYEKIRQLVIAMKANPWLGTVSIIPDFLQATLEHDQAAYEFAAKKRKRKKRRY